MLALKQFSSVLFLYCLSLPAHAGLIVDQNQDQIGGRLATFSSAGLAQSFRQGSDNIAGAGLFLTAAPGFSDTVTLSLWDALPTQTGATRLASASGLAQHDAWLDVFWSPVNLITGHTYFLVFTSANNVFSLAGNRSNPYSDGEAWLAGFNRLPEGDFTFRTYAQVSPVPEPQTLVLFGAGLVAVAGLRRRKSPTDDRAAGTTSERDSDQAVFE